MLSRIGSPHISENSELRTEMLLVSALSGRWNGLLQRLAP
jgi:hypothetical protein